MMPKPLKKILTRQAIFIAMIPFVFLTLIALVWLLPQFMANIESHQIHLAKITALKTENYLVRSMSILQGVSNFIDMSSKDSNYQDIVGSQMKTSESLKAIYVIGPQGKVKAVSLKNGKANQEKELIGLDFSESAIFKESIKQNKPIWSDSFLSVIGGGLSVALAIPGNRDVVMGEIDLGLLTEYLKQIATTKDQLIMVLDRRGQVIADDNGHFTAQQLNLNHLLIVKKGLNQTKPLIDDFKLDGKWMTGCIVKSEFANWSVMVAEPKSVANRPVWTAVILFSMLLLGSIIVAVFIMMTQAIKMSNKFAGFAKSAGKISTGDQFIDWPDFNILEFKELADDIQRMADTIQERERYNRIVFSDSPIPLLIIDARTAQCVDGNESALRILGVASQEKLARKSIFDFSASIQQDGTDSQLAGKEYAKEALEKGSSHFEWVFEGLPNGKLYGEINLASFHSSEKTLIQMSINDITGRKIEEARREKLEDQLRQSQKMESIGTLAGGIAHDFNNILFPVMGFTEMLLEDLSKDDKFSKPLNEILKGCLRAKDLVQQILTFSRQTDKEYKPIRIDLILNEILKLTRSTLPSTIEIQKDILPGTGMVVADPTQIHQIIMNLCTNAFHAMEEQGGILKIRLEAVQFSADTLPSPELIPGWYICLTISDSGIGIDSETLENIFDPYFTTKGKGKGTGLGLSVVHGIVKNYGGKILVESEKFKGTTIKVYLPRASSGQTILIEEASKTDLSGTGHILLVDDERQITIMIEGMIGRLGYQVTSKNSSPDALKIFCESPDSFDLIITDMTMPILTGDLLVKEIKKIRPDMPVILVTGYSDKINQENPIDINVDQILMKPVLKNDLAKAILDAMAKHSKKKSTP